MAFRRRPAYSAGMVSTPPFKRVLVANRGEIAVRVCRGLTELGIEPVVVFSDADVEAVHRFHGAVAYGIGGQTAAESYLQIDKILEAAKATGAEAIHPGYGFLSENAAFVRAVEAAGLVFIGPTAESMELLGSKQSARDVAEKLGVPTVPGFNRDTGDDALLLKEAAGVGYPLMIKASAGGGGKGMRVVECEAEFAEALAAGRREAKGGFGDDTMLLERRVFPARHVEIQVMADNYGKAVSLHERECSVQRRHQKVLEESPSPMVDAELRAKMGAAAVRLIENVGYRNAGTVEFLAMTSGEFYFLEVNTRLQVEHPVTELVTGLDLVHMQVRIAAGEKLEAVLEDRDLTPRGHAIEARIYAEIPEQGYLPAAGDLITVIEAEGPGVRVDSGVHSGSEVSVNYDPMLAKLVVHASDRETACRRMALALRDSVYLGIPTNVDFLRRVVEDEAFVRGDLRTDFLDLNPSLASGPDDAAPDEAYVAAVLVAALGGTASTRSGAPASSGGRANVWDSVGPVRFWQGEA